MSYLLENWAISSALLAILLRVWNCHLVCWWGEWLDCHSQPKACHFSICRHLVQPRDTQVAQADSHQYNVWTPSLMLRGFDIWYSCICCFLPGHRVQYNDRNLISHWPFVVWVAVIRCMYEFGRRSVAPAFAWYSAWYQALLRLWYVPQNQHQWALVVSVGGCYNPRIHVIIVLSKPRCNDVGLYEFSFCKTTAS